MKKTILLGISLSLLSSVTWAISEDDPFLHKVMIDQLEYRDGDKGNPWVWEADAWAGKDLHKLWIKTEGEYVDSKTEEAEGQLLYSRAILPYWDVQVGWLHEFRPRPNRDWFAFALKGLAPYFFEIDASLFVGEEGRTALRVQAEHELMFTQRLVLSPEVELNLFGKDDPERGIGSGLSDIEAGLRLRYEFRREFAPYVGVNWTKRFGDTADFARDEGESTSDVQFVTGVRAWF